MAAYDDIEEIKTWLGIAGATYDNFLAQCNDHLSQLSDLWTGRSFPDVVLGAAFNTHSVTEIFYVDGRDGVVLREWPIVSVQSVFDDGDTVASGSYATSKGDGWIQFLDSADSLPMNRYGKIEITYVAGFNIVPFPVLNFIRRGSSYFMNRRLAEGLGADLIADTQITFRGHAELENLFDETVSVYTLDFGTHDGITTGA